MKNIAKVMLILSSFYICSIANRPVLTNEIALSQMQNSDLSYVIWSTYQAYSGWLWLVPIAISFLLYRKQIMSFIKNQKGRLQ